MNYRTMRLDTKNNGAAGYLSAVKIELRKVQAYCQNLGGGGGRGAAYL